MDTLRDEFLAAARRGDRIALQQLLLADYGRLADSLRPRIPAALQAVIDVKDILQMTFIHVFRDFSALREGDANAFYGWMRAIADTRLSDTIRAAMRKKRGGDRIDVQTTTPDASASFLNLLNQLSAHGRSPGSSAAAHEAVDALQVALASLPDDQRQAVWLHHIENLTLEEVVEKMKRTEPAIRGLLHRGKKALRQSLGKSSAWFSRTDG